jgi:hypothetical protein
MKLKMEERARNKEQGKKEDGKKNEEPGMDNPATRR